MRDVLLVIDVQTMLVEALPAERWAAFERTLADLIARARDRAVPVVYVRHNDEELVLGTPGWEIAEPIAPLAGEPIVDKRYSDAFRETNLAAVLTELGAERLIVCGMQTEFCVDSTAREAERRGFRVTLVADGHATFDTDDATESQIRDHVHRVLSGSRVVTLESAASVVPAAS